ncbi:MAG: alpha/beta fold hydrolase [Pseudomonadales bacterium]
MAGQPRLIAGHIVAADGYRLPLHRWPATGRNAAVVLGLHGFNDHGGGFEALGQALSPRGISLYAYDQRGFGATAGVGGWPGNEVLMSDARAAAGLLRQRYPETPLYLLGTSMGGAVALLAMTGAGADANSSTAAIPPVAGTILLAPAVLGRPVMPGYQRFGLWLGERLAPGLPVSVRIAHALGYHPTDQPEVIDELRADPLVPNHTRVAAAAGLVDLMDAALLAAPGLQHPTLLLYGAKDDLVPVGAICALLDGVAKHGEHWQVSIYPDGFHLLTRYSGAHRTYADIEAWLLEPEARDASPRFVGPRQAEHQLCRN